MKCALDQKNHRAYKNIVTYVQYPGLREKWGKSGHQSWTTQNGIKSISIKRTVACIIISRIRNKVIIRIN